MSSGSSASVGIARPSLRRRDRLDQSLDQLVRRQAVGLGVEVRQHAVDQHRPRQRADVLDRRRVAAVQDGARLGRQHQVLRGAGTRAPGDVLLVAPKSLPPVYPRQRTVWRHD